MLAEQAEAQALMPRQLPPLSRWLHVASVEGETYPFALIGPSRRPVDVWFTIRGEVTMGRRDPVRWLSLGSYLALAQKALVIDEALVPHDGHESAS
jgi:hypothetical protein